VQISRFAQLAAVVAVGAIALSGCASNEDSAGSSSSSSSSDSASLTGTLKGSGSSAQDSAQSAWISGFQSANTGVTINYSPDGSGAGVEAFTGGGVQYAGSDAALTTDQVSTGGFKACAADSSAMDLPVYISPIALVYNVKGVTDLNLDAKTIANIFNGSITKWNDAAIAKLNPKADLPSTAITAVHRSDDSGTTDNFTDYLADASKGAWGKDASETFPFKSGEGANGTSGVIDAVTKGTGTIGYADMSQAGTLDIANIEVGGKYIAPSAEAAAADVAASPIETGRADNDLAVDIDRVPTDSTEYPLVLVSYLIVCDQYEDSAVKDLVTSYATYVASADGQKAAASAAGSAPLSSDLSSKVTTAIAAIK
jgi:phosphate transport system substrate-binding protein